MLALVERYSKPSLHWDNLSRKKRVLDLSVEEILQDYQGFEGKLIASFPEVWDEKKLEAAIPECLGVKGSHPFVMLFINSNLSSVFPMGQKKLLLAGYEVGIFDKQIHSSIFNEILFGHFDELIAYKQFLNKNCLFFDSSLALKYLKFHDQMSKQGKGVENNQKMNIYQIWKFEA